MIPERSRFFLFLVAGLVLFIGGAVVSVVEFGAPFSPQFSLGELVAAMAAVFVGVVLLASGLAGLLAS